MLAVYLGVLCLVLWGSTLADEIKVLTNSSHTITLGTTTNDATLQYGFHLQKNSLMVRLNSTLGTTHPTSHDFAVLPSIMVETNASLPVLKSYSVRGFLNFATNEEDWGSGLLLSKRNAEVYEVSASWNCPSNKSLNFRVQLFVTSNATVYQGLTLRPNEIAWISSIIDFPFLLRRSTLTLDEILLNTGTPVNRTVPGAYVFSVSNTTALYINSTAIVDGKTQKILLSETRSDDLWSRVKGASNSTFNLAGRNVDDALLIFQGSSGAKNITFAQRLVLNPSALSGKTVANGHSKGEQSLAVLAIAAIVLLSIWCVI